jgi:hypothetical protein
MAGKINLKGVSGNTFQIGLNGVTLDASAVTTPYTLQLPETLGNVDESIIIGTNGNLEFGHTRKLVGDDSNISIDQDGAIRLAINGQANVISVEGDGTSSNVFFNTTLNLDSPSNLKIGGGLPDYLLVSNGTDLEYRSADSLLVIPQVSKISFDVTVAGDAQSFTSADLLQYVDNTNVLPVVHRNGVYVDDSTYSITGDTITFNHYLRAGECIDILPSQTKVLAGVGDGTVKSISVGGGGLGFSLGGGTITTSGTVSLNVPPATQLANVLANSGLASNQYVVDAINAIPAVDLNGLASTVYVDNKIANVSADLTGYATETFVTNEIANIAIPSITGLATETYVDNAIANVSVGNVDLTGYVTDQELTGAIANIAIPSIVGLATETYVDNAIANVSVGNVDLTGYATENFVTNEIANIAIPSIVGLATETFVDNSINALGNIRTVNLDGNVANVLSGNGTFVKLNAAPGSNNQIIINRDGNLYADNTISKTSLGLFTVGEASQGYAVASLAYSGSNSFRGSSIHSMIARGTRTTPLPLQNGDRIFGISAQAYTGNGTGTVDGKTGWFSNNAISITGIISELPLANATAPSVDVSFNVMNATANNFATFGFSGKNKTFSTPGLVITTSTPPATATSFGVKGTVTYDADYVYVCVDDNVWKRSPLSTW